MLLSRALGRDYCQNQMSPSSHSSPDERQLQVHPPVNNARRQTIDAYENPNSRGQGPLIQTRLTTFGPPIRLVQVPLSSHRDPHRLGGLQGRLAAFANVASSRASETVSLPKLTFLATVKKAVQYATIQNHPIPQSQRDFKAPREGSVEG